MPSVWAAILALRAKQESGTAHRASPSTGTGRALFLFLPLYGILGKGSFLMLRETLTAYQRRDPAARSKLEIFLPPSHLEAVQAALRQADAGHIGRYDSCLSYHPVTSCWRPLEGTHPYLGTPGQVSQEAELKVEVTCRTEEVDQIIAAVKAVHPYEEPVINAIPLFRTSF